MFEIFCDAIQEGMWFRNQHPDLEGTKLIIIPNAKSEQRVYGLENVLQYDRPDIILKHHNQIILVLEKTVEVPSGHNVGQRFGRLVAAAKERIPAVYFGPYMAYKHGGDTAGPRYMNLRLFYSLAKVSDIYDTAITTINWPVDRQCEVLKLPEKDMRVKKYMELFFSYYNQHGFGGLTQYIKDSKFQQEQINEQQQFAKMQVRSPEQYDVPPNSVEIISRQQFEKHYISLPSALIPAESIVVYNVGMNYIRSDPYVGMAALYHYLYCDEKVVQVQYFPNIESSEWYALRKSTKTYRMFKEFSDAILFKDKIIERKDL